MAPFLTHLMIGEHVWAELEEYGPPGNGWHAAAHGGAFLLGCLAPDVDKFCEGLEQSTTHFVAKDRNFAWVSERTRRFLDGPADLMRAPYGDLVPAEQAFVLGYLCHVATDEATGRFAQRMFNDLTATGKTFPNVDAFLTVIDPRLWAMTLDPGWVVTALERASVPNGPFPFIPADCLEALRQGVLPQVRAGGGFLPYLGMVRRHWQWCRHGRVSDAPDDPDLERDLEAHRRRVEVDLGACERLADDLDLVSLARDARAHSRQCIQALLAQEKRR
ncbi:MAG: zinc dependent phospholipase C family protein [Anaerolineae bacterium]|nr:zinc dependent phospholipase C family protein [Anaerolineae bacterium]